MRFLLMFLVMVLFAFTSVKPAQATGSVITMAPIAGRDEVSPDPETVRENVRLFREQNKNTTTTTRRSNPNKIQDNSNFYNNNISKSERRYFSSNQEEDIYCLTEAIYFESLHEPQSGQMAVANVIMNRATWNGTNPMEIHRREFRGSICDVVAFKAARKWKKRKRTKSIMVCAFSYRCERGFRNKLQHAQRRPVWEDIKTLATNAYMSYNSDENADPSKGATFYHADYVSPKWRHDYQKTVKIGRHIFYRIRG